MRQEYEVEEAINRYSDTVKRICMLHLKNWHDTEDIAQNVFMKYAMCDGEFQNREHERAWIIKVAVNQSRDLIRNFFRKNVKSFEEVENEIEKMAAPEGENPEQREFSKELLSCVLKMPEKYKVPIYLFYYEGYTAVEIGEMLGKNVNTVYTALSRGREILKKQLGGEIFD